MAYTRRNSGDADRILGQMAWFTEWLGGLLGWARADPSYSDSNVLAVTEVDLLATSPDDQRPQPVRAAIPLERHAFRA